VFVSPCTALWPAKLPSFQLLLWKQLNNKPQTSTSLIWDPATTDRAQTSTAWSPRTF
ncbi:hypothetical protein GOODEAATRI_011379, partial [Goodea atripinnis]